MSTWISGLIAFALAAASGADPLQPSLGNVRALSEIEPESHGVVDVDVFGGTLLRGERVQAVIRRVAGSTLEPAVALHGPGGGQEPAVTRSLGGGRLASFARYTVPASGPYEVRVSGVGGTTGAYEAVFTVVRHRERERIAGSADSSSPSVLHRFHAVDGAFLTVTARWRSGEAPLRLASVEDPSGTPVPGAAAATTAGPRSISLRRFKVRGAPGEYLVRLERDPAAAGTTRYDVRIDVQSPPRPRARKTWSLRLREPRLAAIPDPVEALPGANATFRGANFSADEGVRVELDGAPCVVVSSSATHVEVTVPQGQPGTTADVAIVNADGQGDARPGYFRFLTPAVVPTLEPGSGFTGPTPQPAPAGAGKGIDAQAIARWDVVPFQTVTDRLRVGVVAFHIAGIDRVEFSVNGGPWAASREMTLNPDSGVWEYCIDVDATKLPDGPFEVRAVVHPRVGIARVLAGPIDGGLAYRNGNHSLLLSANSGGTLVEPVAYCGPAGSDATGDGTAAKPYRSPSTAMLKLTQQHGSADGARIYLQPGRYTWGPPPYPYPKTTHRWATMLPAPGAQRSEVIFDSSESGGFRTRLVRAENVTVQGAVSLRTSDESYLWVDKSVLIGPGRTIDSSFLSAQWWSGTHFTSCDVSANRNGIRSVLFTRDCYVHDISGSPFGDSPFVVNSRMARYDNSGTEFHGDVFHWYQDVNTWENFIVYNVEAKAFPTQGLFAEVWNGQNPLTSTGREMHNVALVNLHISKERAGPEGSWWNRGTNHLLLWHVSLPDQPFRWDQTRAGTTVKNVSIVGSIFESFYIELPPPDSIVDYIHFTRTDVYGSMRTGTHVSTGNAGFADVLGLDYQPSATSPLVGRVPRIPGVPVDIHNRPRADPTAIGPYRGPAEQ